jgi:hypothetical protein
MQTPIRSISAQLAAVNSDLHARQGWPLKLTVVVHQPVYQASADASFLISSTYIVHHHLPLSQGIKLHQYAIVMVYFILQSIALMMHASVPSNTIGVQTSVTSELVVFLSISSC